MNSVVGDGNETNIHQPADEISLHSPDNESRLNPPNDETSHNSPTDEIVTAYELVDLDMYNLLKKWDMSHLYEHLLVQGITFEALKILKIHHIERILRQHTVATQIYFEHHLEKWRESIGAPLLQMHANSAHFRPLQQNSTFTNTTSASVANEGNTNLATILNNSRKGGVLIEFFNKNKQFYEEQRNALVALIAQYFNDNDIHLSLSLSHKMEREIVERFPSEKIGFYRALKRGKLYNKYCNIKAATKAMQNDKITAIVEDPTLLKSSEDDAEIIIRKLKNDKLATDEFDRYWGACSIFRLKKIKELSTFDIFKEWPEYKMPNGYRLIDIDFCKNYTSSSILDTWDRVQQPLMEILSSEIHNKNIKSLLGEFENVNSAAPVLWAIHGLLVPSQRDVKIEKGKKNITRYSISDSQDSFMAISKSVAEIEETLKYKEAQKVHIQPFLIIIGESIVKIEEIYVYFDGIKYPMTNILRAVDICFKIFILFDLEYPKASETFWSFIQLYFYDIPLKKKFLKVSVLISEIEKKKNN